MLIFELLKSMLIGIVQGITEWLPVSSTGHMILLDELISLNVSDEFYKMFLVVIQLGSILAVLFLYFHRLNPLSHKKSAAERKGTWQMWLRVVIAVIPAGVMGLLLDDFFDAHFYNYITVACALVIYGVLFIVIERRKKNAPCRIDSAEQVDLKTAFLIGCFQILALIPGTSRSGSTILGAMLLGVSRKAAAEFSFFLAIPVMLGASALKLVKFGFNFTGAELAILITAFVTAFLVSLAAIRFLVEFVRRHSFEAFGWYRIALGVIVLAAWGITSFV